jgi:hypothetical protein
MSIIHAVLQTAETPDERQALVREFAVCLTPHAIFEQETTRAYIRYTLCLPITTGEGRLFWLLVSRDHVATILPADGRGAAVEVPLPDLTWRDKTLSAAGASYRFSTDRAAELFVNRDRESDPLVSFLSCFREVLAYPSYCPGEFTRQLMDALGAPGLVLGCAVAQSRRDALPHVLAGFGNSEMLVPFLRAEYARDVAGLTEQGRIFRDNSVGMAASGVLLRAHGAVLVPELTEVLSREADAKPGAVMEKWLPILSRLPAVGRIVLREAFFAARRRYPDQLTPLTAIGGMLMLRFVMADVAEKVPHLTKMLQNLMQITVFNPTVRKECEKAVFDAVAEMLLELLKLPANNVPRWPFSLQELAEAIGASLDDVKANVRPGTRTAVHPVVISVQELIETVFVGTDDDHRQKLSAISVNGPA